MIKIPRVSKSELAAFCRCITDEREFYTLPASEQVLFDRISVFAANYCASQTGLEIDADGATDNDLGYAVMVVGAEMYDNRQMTAQYTTQNPMVRAILGQYAVNLLPEADADA